MKFSELSIEKRLSVVQNHFMECFLDGGVPFTYVKPAMYALALVEYGSKERADQAMELLQSMVDILGIDGTREVLSRND